MTEDNGSYPNEFGEMLTFEQWSRDQDEVFGKPMTMPKWWRKLREFLVGLDGTRLG